MFRFRWVVGVVLAAMAAIPAANAATPRTAAQTGPAAAHDARTLYLRAATVDLRNKPSLLKPGATFQPGTRYVLQLDGPITPARRDALAAHGVVLDDYIPMNAYVAELSRADAAGLLALGYVAWVGEYDRAWKRCPNIGRLVPVSPERQALATRGQVRLVAYAFKRANADSCARSLKQSGATLRKIMANGADRRVLLDIARDQCSKLCQVGDVMFIEEALEPEPRNATTNWIMQSNVSNMTPLWDAGLHGENQIAGIIDWFMQPDHCAFDDPASPGCPSVANPVCPAHRKIQAYFGIGGSTTFGQHGTHVAGVCVGDELAGTDPNLKGIAFKGRVVFQNMNSEFNNNVAQLLTNAHNNGARVHNNSWGAAGTSYNLWARDMDVFTGGDGVTPAHEEDLVLVAITDFTEPVQLPENAKNCLAVSASQDAPFQDSRCVGGFGPTADGRRKPELLAPGCGSVSADLFTPLPCLTNTAVGTSFAAPAVAGMAMLVRQYYMDGFYPGGAANPPDAFLPSGALLKATLINSAVDMTGVAGYPSGFEGWGRVLADDALFFAGDARKLSVQDVWNASGLSTGQTMAFPVDVAAGSMPLKITLVWTDVAGSPGVALTPTNNLDLRVTAPDASVFLGNVFTGGQSATGGTADALNNTEQVHRLSPVAGMYTIEVIGTAVAVGTQGFALVITGDLTPAVPNCAAATPADVNNDGLVNGADIQPFVSMLIAFDGTIDTPAECAADIGSSADPCAPDATVDASDVAGFVATVLSGACP
ncbi:MAG: S8 family serine peptidase [Phycisphaerae bacterium]